MTGLIAAMTEVHSLSRLRERAGERVSPQWDNPQEEKALSRRAGRCFASPGRADLSRKRER